MQPQNRPYTILLIDDVAELLHVFALNLTHFEGFHVVTAENGAIGLERYFECEPDCVIIDVKMPELDGYQLTRALRGDPTSAFTPLIILSAMNQDTDRMRGLVSGIDRYLTKPITPSELAAVIREVIALSQEERTRQLQLLLEEEL